MGYSSLATQIKPPKHSKWSSRGGAKIGRVIVHHWAGTAGGVERLVESTDKASVHYIILSDGAIIGSVDEAYRAWTSGSSAADSPSITVEVQNAETKNYTVTDKALASLVALIADVATRHGFTPSRETVRGHKEFSSTACPGPYLWPMVDDGSLAARAVAVMGGSSASAPAPSKPATTTKKNANAHRAYGSGEVLAIQKKLAAAGFYGGLLDDDYGPATEAGVRAYQAAQLYGSLVVDGDWGPACEAHYRWVIALQTALNEWKSSYAALVVDGSYGALTARRVLDVQTRNHGGAYLGALDGVPGPVTCSMLGIPTHP